MRKGAAHQGGPAESDQAGPRDPPDAGLSGTSA